MNFLYVMRSINLKPVSIMRQGYEIETPVYWNRLVPFYAYIMSAVFKLYLTNVYYIIK